MPLWVHPNRSRGSLTVALWTALQDGMLRVWDTRKKAIVVAQPLHTGPSGTGANLFEHALAAFLKERKVAHTPTTGVVHQQHSLVSQKQLQRHDGTSHGDFTQGEKGNQLELLNNLGLRFCGLAGCVIAMVSDARNRARCRCAFDHPGLPNGRRNRYRRGRYAYSGG